MIEKLPAPVPPLCLQKEFTPCRGSSTGVMATEGDRMEVESLPLAAERLGDFVRGRISLFKARESARGALY